MPPQHLFIRFAKIYAALPPSGLITVIHPQHPDVLHEPILIEARAFDSIRLQPTPLPLTWEEFMAFYVDGFVQKDSDSGADPNLYYRYVHYTVTPADDLKCRIGEEAYAVIESFQIKKSLASALPMDPQTVRPRQTL